MRCLFIPALFISFSLFAQITDFDTVSFQSADSISRFYMNHDLSDPEHLAQVLTQDLKSDAEKFRVIFKWICDNISYDVSLYQQQRKKNHALKYNRRKLSKWDLRLSKKSYKRVIINKTALCSGYAMLLERMSRSVGLECFIVEGYARDFTDRVNHGNVNHAWNVVRLSNKWYLADVTWASGYVDEQATIFTRNFNGNYFLTEPGLFIANHYPRKESWTLLYNRPTLKQFLSAPIKTSAFIQNKINQYSPEIGKLKVKQDSSVVFSFTTNAEYKPQKAIVEVIVSKSIEEFTYELSQDTKGEFSFSHCFTKKGFKRVHIYMKNKLTFVYEVSVQ